LSCILIRKQQRRLLQKRRLKKKKQPQPELLPELLLKMPQLRLPVQLSLMHLQVAPAPRMKKLKPRNLRKRKLILRNLRKRKLILRMMVITMMAIGEDF
jgi:hypothetical protein